MHKPIQLQNELINNLKFEREWGAKTCFSLSIVTSLCVIDQKILLLHDTSAAWLRKQVFSLSSNKDCQKVMDLKLFKLDIDELINEFTEVLST